MIPANQPPAQRISIHAPHTRSDQLSIRRSAASTPFQSTLLIRGATLPTVSPRDTATISIHAPHTRSDHSRGRCLTLLRKFQSTLLIRGATLSTECEVYFLHLISIHAPHTRSDDNGASGCAEAVGFQSTLLIRGATISKISMLARQSRFQSTLLIRGATPCSPVTLCGQTISIHAPHTRSDTGGRTKKRRNGISIHAPHTRSDQIDSIWKTSFQFQSTLLIRGATRLILSGKPLSNFNPRSSYEERPD